METRIIHSSDWHLRDAALARRDRGDDFRRAVTNVATTAINEKAHAILQTGDLLNDTRPSSTNIRFLFELNLLLEQAGIPMFVVHGDHDKTDPHWCSMIKDADDRNFSRGGIFVLENELITIPGTDVTVYGQSFIGKTQEAFLTIRDAMPKADILMMHMPLREFIDFPNEVWTSMSDLPRNRYRVMALGDLHITDYRTLEDGTIVGYPGSTELCKRDEPLAKSVTEFRFNGAEPVVLQQIPIKTRKALCYQINTEEQAQQAILDLSTHAADNPMVFVRYNPQLEGLAARINAVVDPNKAIVRTEPMYSDFEIARITSDLETSKAPADFLPQFFTPGTGLYDTAMALLNPEIRPNDALDAYIEKRLKDIEQAATH